MSTVIGLVVVFASVAGGFAMVSGPFAVLLQPSEFLVIGGAAFGSLLISAPGKVAKRVRTAMGRGFRVRVPKKQDYMDLLMLQAALFQVIRKDGALALEQHVETPDESPIFSKYASVKRQGHAFSFLRDALRMVVDGCPAHEMALLFDAELETMHEAEHQPIGVIRTTADALPGLGIVAAVLGIIVTMGHLDAGPEVIGHHVAAALVGTFLGILLCYGFLGPIAAGLEMQAAAGSRYVQCIKEGLLASLRGSAPSLALEFARRAIYPDERPTFEEVARALEDTKGDAEEAPASAPEPAAA